MQTVVLLSYTHIYIYAQFFQFGFSVGARKQNCQICVNFKHFSLFGQNSKVQLNLSTSFSYFGIFG